MIDSHCHLRSCDAPVEELLAECRAAGVERVVTIGCGRESSEDAVALCDLHPEVFAAVGVHPHDADGFTPADLVWLRDLAAHPKVVAIGECGLDYHYDNSTRPNPRRAFVAQGELAADLGLPLVIHTREAAADTLEVLGALGHAPVILHCFSIPEHLDEVLERGHLVSLAGPVTFPRSTALQDAARRVPADRLLVETDAPYLAPVPRRGRPNRPANVAHTLAFVAGLRGEEPAALDAATTATARRVFGW